MKFPRWFVRWSTYESALAAVDMLHRKLGEAEDAVDLHRSECRNERDALQRENVALKGALREAKEKAMDEWRRGERLADEVKLLRAEVAHANDGINEARANIDEMQQAHEAHIAKLVDPRIASLEMTKGGILELGVEPSMATKILAASFAETLGDAPNWASFEVGPFPTWQGKLLVTVRRCSGESPEFQVGKLKDEVERLKDEAAMHKQSYEDAEDDADRFQAQLDSTVEMVRQLRDACYLSRLAFRAVTIHVKNYRPEIDATTAAIYAADRFLKDHTTPEPATHDA